MDKRWMNEDSHTTPYIDGLDRFIQFVFTHSARGNTILCRCRNFYNCSWLEADVVREHLVCDGFVNGYTRWEFHGEATIPPNVDHVHVGEEEAVEEEDDFEEYDEMADMIRDMRNAEGNFSDRSDHDEGPSDNNDESEAFKLLADYNSEELYPFVRTHSRRKDGTPIDRYTGKIISDILIAIDTNPKLLEKFVEQGDILTHVLGKEKNGYVWCVGMGPSPGRIGIPGGQKLKFTRLQMAEEETKEVWRANDVLRDQVEEIQEETKSKIDILMEEIDLLKWMMTQTIASNNKNIAREPEGSVGESFAVEDYNDLHDEEERIQQEMRKAKECFEKKQTEVELLQKKKDASKEAAIRKQTELLQKKKEVELSLMKGSSLNQNKEAALVQRMKDSEANKKQQEIMQKKKDAEM